MEKHILLFGFGPFSNYKENPTEILLNKLSNKMISNAIIHTKILPVTYEKIENIIEKEIDRINPDIVLGTGLAPGRSRISLEKIAINYQFSEFKDNNGKIKKGIKIIGNGEDGIFTNINIEKIVDELNSKGIPAEISLSAGGYICNKAMYVIIHYLKDKNIPSGFIHFPCHEELASKYNLKCPVMSLKTMEKGLKIIIKSIL